MNKNLDQKPEHINWLQQDYRTIYLQYSTIINIYTIIGPKTTFFLFIKKSTTLLELLIFFFHFVCTVNCYFLMWWISQNERI